MRPYIGVLVWSWLGYMNPHRLTYGAAFDFPFAQIIGLVTLVALLFSSEKKRFPLTSVTVVWLIFVFWMNLTTVFSLVPDDAWAEWDRTMKIQLFSFVSILLMRGRDRIHYLIGVIVVSIGFYTLKGGIFSLLTGSTSRVYGPPGSFIEENNGMGLAALMVLPLIIYFFTQIKSWYVRTAMLAVIGFSVLSILTSQSRGAFLGIIATVVFMWWRMQKKVLVGLAILIAAPVFWFSMPEQWHERMATIVEYDQDASAMGRINAWHFAYNLALDRPLVGGGFATFDAKLFRVYAPDPEDLHDAHSIYFEVLGEHGFVGLGLFLLLGMFALRAASQIIRMTRDEVDLQWANMLAKMLQASLVAYAAGGLFLGLAYFDLYYHIIALTVLLREHVADIPIPGTVRTRVKLYSANGSVQ